MNESTNAGGWGKTIAVAAVALLALTLVATAYVRTSELPAAQAEVQAETLDPGDMSAIAPILVQKPTDADALPDFLVSGPQSFTELDPASTRWLGAGDNASYWIALDQQAKICLISLIDGKDKYASMTCKPADVVWKQGIAMQVASKSFSTQLYFVPAPYAQDLAGFSRVGNQLLVGDASQKHESAGLKSTSADYPNPLVLPLQSALVLGE